MLISLAPLQGLTEFPFRNAIHHLIGGIDNFYSPFLRLENDGSLKSKYVKDILPENNSGTPIIPQILVNTTKDFLFLANIIEDYGYREVNWNLGCPYPMVSKRKLGSGLIPYPEEIKEILEVVIPKTKLKISIKIRAGLIEPTEIFSVLNALESLPLTEIIIHPRIAKQLYKGTADGEVFIQAQKQTAFKLAYNGDITSKADFDELLLKLPDTNHFMIGRGLIANPFLGIEIKNGTDLPESEKRQLFFLFHQEILYHFEKKLSGDAHALNKMHGYWEYWSSLFSNSRKIYKLLKKVRCLNDYNKLTSEFIKNEPLTN
ncbi:MAG: tRNA dihydrouridine synthase [Salinivirgaceae bacterium]